MLYAGDIIDEVLVELQAGTTAGYYSDAALRRWVDKAHKFAAGYKKWPFTEGRVSTTYSSTEEWNYPEGWKPDSIRLLQVGGERFQKLNFEDYQIYKEEQPDGEDKIFSDFSLTYFVNTNADVSGTMTVYGQYTPATLDLTTSNVATVFTLNGEEGNNAIAEEMLSYAKIREKNPAEAKMHHENAVAILDALWELVQGEKHAYHGKDRGMFTRFDVLGGNLRDDLLDENRFY